jgi:diguanylate cyclase (GGDEF)-like protein/PAS domain S-box-containing protein
MTPSVPPNESERLRILHRLQILDTEEEKCFNDVVEVAADLWGVPMALISLVDSDRQWFKAKRGVALCGSSRSDSLCGHVVGNGGPVLIPDTIKDARFIDNPFVAKAPGIRFYVGVPVYVDDQIIGTLCVLDVKPHRISKRRVRVMEGLARHVSDMLEARLQVQLQEQLNSQLRLTQTELENRNQALADNQNALAHALETSEENSELQKVAAKRFERLFRDMPVACFTYDLDARIFEWNEAAESLFGFCPHEAVGETLYDVFSAGKKSRRVQMSIAQVLSGQTVKDKEWTYRTPSGEKRRILTSSFPLVGRGNRIVGGMGAHVDITARRQHEVTLRENELRLTSMVENLPAGAVFVRGDRVRVNRFVEQLTGYSRDDVDSLDKWFRSVYVGTSFRQRKIYLQCRENGFPDAIAVPITCKDGTSRLVEFAAFQSGSFEVWLIRDLTDRELAQEAVARSEERLRLIMTSMREGLFVVEPNGEVSFCNPSAERILGISKKQMASFNPGELFKNAIHLDGSPFVADELPTSVALGSGNSVFDSTLGVEQSDGNVRWISFNAVPTQLDGDENGRSVVCSLADVTERVETAEQVQSQMDTINEYAIQLEMQRVELEHRNVELVEIATTDPLTGIMNRRAFQEALEREYQMANRQGCSLSVAMFDVDRFKAYNDDFGHPAGDSALQRVAFLLKNTLRLTDYVARYGGEEFVVILPSTCAEAAKEAAERLRVAIETAEFPCRPVTVSVGVATLAPEMVDEQNLVETADRALYAAKRSGRNRVVHAQDQPSHDSESAA